MVFVKSEIFMLAFYPSFVLLNVSACYGHTVNESIQTFSLSSAFCTGREKKFLYLLILTNLPFVNSSMVKKISTVRFKIFGKFN